MQREKPITVVHHASVETSRVAMEIGIEMVFSFDGDRKNTRRRPCRPMGIGPSAGQNSPQRLRKARRCLRSENDARGHVDGADFRAGLVVADPTQSKRLKQLSGFRSNTHRPLA